MALIQVNYMSNALARQVTMNVILPSDRPGRGPGGYAPAKADGFPTLYLLHGMLGNYMDWVTRTNILALAEERGLAVVMPSGDNSFYFEGRMPFDDYESFIGKELPLVTRRMFPLSKRREDTFIAGLSMGGYGALRIGTIFSETFSHVAGLSSAIEIFMAKPPKEWKRNLFDDPMAAAKTDLHPRVAYEELLSEGRPSPCYYLACGTKDALFDDNRAFRDFLTEKGADVTWDEEDASHEWPFWDRQIKKVLSWLPAASF